jgi:hypothetical protein
MDEETKIKIAKARAGAENRYSQTVSNGLDSLVTRGPGFGLFHNTTMTAKEWLAFEIIHNSRWMNEWSEWYKQENLEYIKLILERNPDIRAPTAMEISNFARRDADYRHAYIIHDPQDPEVMSYRDCLCDLAKKLILKTKRKPNAKVAEEFYHEEEKYSELIKKYSKQYIERLEELNGCYSGEEDEATIYLSFREELEDSKSEDWSIYLLASSHAVQKGLNLRRPTPEELEEAKKCGRPFYNSSGNWKDYKKIARGLLVD